MLATQGSFKLGFVVHTQVGLNTDHLADAKHELITERVPVSTARPPPRLDGHFPTRGRGDVAADSRHVVTVEVVVREADLRAVGQQDVDAVRGVSAEG